MPRERQRTRVVSIRYTEGEFEWLMNVAKRRGLTISEHVRSLTLGNMEFETAIEQWKRKYSR